MALAADHRCIFLCSGNCWTLHPWKDSPPAGQNKVPGSLRANLGSVPVPAQVNNLRHCVIVEWQTFSQLPLTSQPACFFLFFFWPFSSKCKIIFSPLSPQSCQICHPLNHLFLAFLSVRNKIALDSTQALFLLVAEKSMSCMSSSMGEVYSLYRDTDGFLYITYASQEMFGAPPPAARPPCWARSR